MLVRIAAIAATSVVVLCGTATHAWAEPDIPEPVPPAAAEGIAPPPPPDGAIPSAEPSVLATSDGWNLKATGSNETLLAVAPLTTALTSREYVAGGTFSGAADWIKNWNEDPKPFAWTKTADEILERLASYLQRIPGAGHQ